MIDYADGSHVLCYEGDLSIVTVADLHVALSRALQDSASVTLDCRAVTGVDVSVLQLFLSAQRTAAAAGKALSLVVPPDGAVAYGLAAAGIPPSALDIHGVTT